MNYCKKCNKIIEKKEETYKGLCFDCYREYLFEKIEYIGDDEYVAKFFPENKLKKFLKAIKKFFSKRNSS